MGGGVTTSRIQDAVNRKNIGGKAEKSNEKLSTQLIIHRHLKKTWKGGTNPYNMEKFTSNVVELVEQTEIGTYIIRILREK